MSDNAEQFIEIEGRRYDVTKTDVSVMQRSDGFRYIVVIASNEPQGVSVMVDCWGVPERVQADTLAGGCLHADWGGVFEDDNLSDEDDDRMEASGWSFGQENADRFLMMNGVHATFTAIGDGRLRVDMTTTAMDDRSEDLIDGSASFIATPTDEFYELKRFGRGSSND